MKTRLAAATSADWGIRVAKAFLLDTVERLAGIDAARVLAFAPPAAHRYFAEIGQGRFHLTAQTKGDLGRRMTAFFAEQFQAGATAVVLVGTDSPTLPLPFILQAFQELEKVDVVIGPSTDGGYYLIGCAHLPFTLRSPLDERTNRHAPSLSPSPPPCLPRHGQCGRSPREKEKEKEKEKKKGRVREVAPLFEGISWGTSLVLSDTMAVLQDPKWRLALLPPWYDVDTLDDWRMLQGHVAAQRRAGLDPGVPHTERLLHCQEP